MALLLMRHGAVVRGSSSRLGRAACYGPLPIRHFSQSSSTKRGGVGMVLKRTLQGTGLLLVAGFGARYYTDEGTRRSVAFWRVAGPGFLHYRWVDYSTQGLSPEERDRRFNELHDYYAPICEELILRLRGFYLKLAQLMSTIDYFLPDQYLTFCKRMQNEVPTEFAPGEAEEVVRRNLGLKSLDEVFSEFQPEPIGSASIGQVHLARLKKTGEQVAVKIMGRGVEDRFRADIATMIDFVTLAMPQHIQPMLEFQRQFETEFDYRGEAKNLQDVRTNILPHFSHKVHIPKPYMDLCTKEVLVMEYIPGPTVIKGIRQSYSEYAKRKGTTLEALEAEQMELMSRPDFKFRDLSDEEKRVKAYNKILRMRDTLSNVGISVYNWTIAPVLGFKAKENVHSTELINLGEIINTLAEVHAWEVLKDGAFSCDPHPGNVLLMPDGRLGLIDLGQFKRISKQTRLGLAKMMIAIVHGDEAEIVRVLRRLGVRTTYNKSEVMCRGAIFWYDRNSQDVLKGRNIQQFMEDMEAEDPSDGLPEELIMPGRLSVILRSFGNAFGIDLSIAQLWEKVAQQVLEENGIKYVPRRSKASEVPDGFDPVD